MEDKQKQDIEQDWSDLLFGVRCSIRYHNYRRKFFDWLSVCSDFLVIISGGTVVGFACSSATEHRVWMIVFGALVSIIASFDLVIGFSNKGRDHFDLARRFSELERQITAVGPKPTENDLIALTNRRLEIEQDEPPIKRVLNCYCHNEVIRAMDYPLNQKVKITFWQSFFMQWFDWFPSALIKICDIKPEQSESPGQPPKAVLGKI